MGGMHVDSGLAEVGEPEYPSSRNNVVRIVNTYFKDSSKRSNSNPGAEDPLLKKAARLLGDEDVDIAQSSSYSDAVRDATKKLYSAEKHAVEVLEKVEKTTFTPMTTKQSSTDKAGGIEKDMQVKHHKIANITGKPKILAPNPKLVDEEPRIPFIPDTKATNTSKENTT